MNEAAWYNPAAAHWSISLIIISSIMDFVPCPSAVKAMPWVAHNKIKTMEYITSPSRRLPILFSGTHLGFLPNFQLPRSIAQAVCPLWIPILHALIWARKGERGKLAFILRSPQASSWPWVNLSPGVSSQQKPSTFMGSAFVSVSLLFLLCFFSMSSAFEQPKKEKQSCPSILSPRLWRPTLLTPGLKCGGSTEERICFYSSKPGVLLDLKCTLHCYFL